MTHGSPPSGHTRLVVTIVLAVLIGALGAFLLPVLIHEAKRPDANTFRAEIRFAVPATGLPRGADLRVTAERPGLPPLAITEPVPANASAKAVVLLVADSIADAGWPADARRATVASALTFTGLTAVGGDPGTSGVPMSISVSGRPDQSLTLKISLTGGPSGKVVDSQVLIGLSALGVVGHGTDTVKSAAVSHAAAWTRPDEVLAGLLAALQKAGWTVAADVGGAVLVQALPNDADLGSALLTVEYRGAQYPPYAWSIDLLP